MVSPQNWIEHNFGSIRIYVLCSASDRDDQPKMAYVLPKYNKTFLPFKKNQATSLSYPLIESPKKVQAFAYSLQTSCFSASKLSDTT